MFLTRPRPWCVGLCLGALLLCVPAWADAQEAKRLYGQATKAYKLGRFDQAAVLYKRAYEAEKLPGFLFNIGQAHYKAKDYEQAIFFYKAYLRDAPQAKNRGTVRRRIAGAKRALAKRHAAEKKAAEQEERRLEQARLAQEAQAAREKAAAERVRAEAEAAAMARAEAEAKQAAAEKARNDAARAVEEERRRIAEARQKTAEAESEALTTRVWFWPAVGGVAVGAVVAVSVGASLAAGGVWMATAPSRDTVPSMDFRP